MIRPASKFVLSAMAGVAAGLAILIAVFAWLLSVGPISLAFLSPYVEDTLDRAGTQYQIEFDDVVLTWAGWKHTLDIRAVGVGVYSRDGDLVAMLPEVSIGLSGRALLRGEVVLSSLDIIGARARLVRLADGSLDLGFQDGDSDAVGLGTRLVESLLSPPDPTQVAGLLRRVSILDTEVELEDRLSDTVWRASGANVVLLRDQAGLKGSGTIPLQVGEQLIRLEIDGTYSSARGRAEVSVGFSNANPARLQSVAAVFAPFSPVHMPVHGTIGFSLHVDGALSDLTFDLEGGPGHLDLDRYFEAPITARRMALSGTISDGFDVANIRSAVVDLGGPVAKLSGKVFIGEGVTRVRAEGTGGDLTVAALKHLWPTKSALDARNWVAAHLHDGQIDKFRFRIDLSFGGAAGERLPDDAVDVRFDYSDATVSYYDPLPPLTDAAGSARLTGSIFDLTLSEGRIGGLPLTEGTLRVDGLNRPDQSTDIRFVVSGPVERIMTVLDREPLGFARRMGLEPVGLKGNSATRMRLRMPVKKSLLLREIEFSAAANLHDVAVPNLFGSYDLSAGILNLQADGNGLSIDGSAALNGVPMAVAWQRTFARQKASRATFSVSGILDDAGRKALFMPMAGNLRGPATFQLQVVESDGAVRRAAATVGLRQTDVSIPELHWRKPPGVDGTLRLTLRDDDQGRHVESFVIAAGDLAAWGRGEFGSDWSLRHLELDKLAFGGPGGTDVAMVLSPLPDGGYHVAVEGERFDLRPHLAAWDEEGDGADLSLAIIARVGSLIVGDGRRISGLEATARYDDDRITALEMAGDVGGIGPMRARIVRLGKTRQLTVTAQDAGALARATGLMSGARGGKLSATAILRDDLPGRPVEGHVTARDFRLVQAPMLASLLSAASFTGLGDVLNGDGIAFSQLVARFRLEDEAVTLKGVRAHGASLGITAEGTLDLGESTADIKGTIVPAYFLNALPGKIPVLGPLLVGKEGEGVFGLNYTVKGAIDDPRILVNPASALTPGFLRGIFSRNEALPEHFEEGEGR